MNRIKPIHFLILLHLLSLFQASENQGTISTSRPGSANPTLAVPSGLYQFEMGTNLTTNPGMDTTIAIPILLRMGIYKNTEIQVAYANQYLTLGLLYGGIRSINGLDNSIIITTSLTENNESLTEYGACLPVSYSFQNGFSVWGQIAGTFFNNDKADPTMNYSLAIGNSLSDKTSLFFEAYQSQTIGNKSTTENIPISVDCGITYLSENNVQFDLSIGLTFQKDDSNYIETERFLEGGVSFRLPD